MKVINDQTAKLLVEKYGNDLTIIGNTNTTKLLIEEIKRKSLENHIVKYSRDYDKGYTKEYERSFEKGRDDETQYDKNYDKGTYDKSYH